MTFITFLRGYCAVDRCGGFDEKCIRMVTTVLEVILCLGDIQTNKAIEDIINRNYITSNIKRCYENALVNS
jgi:hypothetical protein